MPDDLVLRHDADGVARLTLNRPDKLNALNPAVFIELRAHLDAIAADESVRCVVLGGAGRSFCAGHDLKQMRANDNLEYQRKLFGRCSEMMQKITALPQPVIARVQGMATAAGCQLVATCDLAVAVNDARFAVSGIRLGLFCSTPAVALTRNVSRKRAMEMLLTGDFIDARTARDYGLINRACDADELDAAVTALAQDICSKPARSIRLGKELVYRQLNQPLAEAYQSATEAISCNMMMDEAREGPLVLPHRFEAVE